MLLFSCSVCPTLCWTAARQASLSFTVSRNLLKLMSLELVMPSNFLILCCPLLLCLQSFPASESFPVSQLIASGGQNIGASGSTSVLPISVQDWFDLFAVQGTLKSPLQHHSLKGSILWCLDFFFFDDPTL